MDLVYLSHQDFTLFLRWTLRKEIDGDFKQQLANFNKQISNATLLKDWALRQKLIVEKANFTREFLQCYLWEGKILVDTDTGEVVTPKTAIL